MERFLADATARNLSDSSLKKYRVLLQGNRGNDRASATLEEFAEEKGYQLLKQLDVEVLRDFRQHWKDGPIAARKKLERLRAFFRFAHEGGWISSNPMASSSLAPAYPFRSAAPSRIRIVTASQLLEQHRAPEQ